MKTGIFPTGYNLIQGRASVKTSIVHGYDREALVRDSGKGYEIIEITFNGKPYFIALKGFKIFETPRVSKSGESKALYLARGVNKEDGFLLQYMPAGSITSKHYHKHTREA